MPLSCFYFSVCSFVYYLFPVDVDGDYSVQSRIYDTCVSECFSVFLNPDLFRSCLAIPEVCQTIGLAPSTGYLFISYRSFQACIDRYLFFYCHEASESKAFPCAHLIPLHKRATSAPCFASVMLSGIEAVATISLGIIPSTCPRTLERLGRPTCQLLLCRRVPRSDGRGTELPSRP